MKLLRQVWQANELSDWAIAVAMVLGMVIVFILLKYGVARVAAALARRTANFCYDIAAGAAGATRIWLLAWVALYAGASAVTLPAGLDQLIGTIAVVALLLQAVLWINRSIVCWLERTIDRRRGVDSEAVTVLSLIGFVARLVVWVLALLLVLQHLGFDITALVTGLGIGGVAVALAVQNILGDLLASLSIVLDKPFVIGDFIIVQDYLGTVEHIGLKTTRLRSLSGELIVFSNTDLLKSRIRNYRRMYERRVPFTLGIAYRTPSEKLEMVPRLLRAAVTAQPKTRFDRAHFKECGESALIFEAVYYVLDPDYNVYMDIQQAINFELLRGFAREGIEFAHPTRTVYVSGLAPAAA